MRRLIAIIVLRVTGKKILAVKQPTNLRLPVL